MRPVQHSHPLPEVSQQSDGRVAGSPDDTAGTGQLRPSGEERNLTTRFLAVPGTKIAVYFLPVPFFLAGAFFTALLETVLAGAFLAAFFGVTFFAAFLAGACLAALAVTFAASFP